MGTVQSGKIELIAQQVELTAKLAAVTEVIDTTGDRIEEADVELKQIMGRIACVTPPSIVLPKQPSTDDIAPLLASIAGDPAQAQQLVTLLLAFLATQPTPAAAPTTPFSQPGEVPPGTLDGNPTGSLDPPAVPKPEELSTAAKQAATDEADKAALKRAASLGTTSLPEKAYSRQGSSARSSPYSA